jgi:hypothetical protein
VRKAAVIVMFASGLALTGCAGGSGTAGSSPGYTTIPACHPNDPVVQGCKFQVGGSDGVPLTTYIAGSGACPWTVVFKDGRVVNSKGGNVTLNKDMSTFTEGRGCPAWSRQ